jgi:hypothetical protein
MTFRPEFRPGQTLKAEDLNAVAAAAFSAMRLGGAQQGISIEGRQLGIPSAEVSIALARVMQPWKIGEGTPANFADQYPWTICKLLAAGSTPDGRKWDAQQAKVPVIAPFHTDRRAVHEILLAARVGEHILIIYDRQAGVWIYMGPERQATVPVRITDSEPIADATYSGIELRYNWNDGLVEGLAVDVRILPLVADVPAMRPVAGQQFIGMWAGMGSNNRPLVLVPWADFQAHVLITSNTPDDNGYFPGEVQAYDPQTKTWITLFSCKVIDINR